MFASLNVFLAGLNLSAALVGGLVSAFFLRPRAGVAPDLPYVLLLTVALPWLLAGVPLAWAWRRRGRLGPARGRPGTSGFVVGHALLAFGNAAMLLRLGLTLPGLVAARGSTLGLLLIVGSVPTWVLSAVGLVAIWRARAPDDAAPPGAKERAAATPPADARARTSATPPAGAKPRAESTTPAEATPSLPRWLQAARALAALNLVWVFVATPMVLLAWSAGLVHASAPDLATFATLIVTAVTVLGFVPLAVFAPDRWALGRELRVVGALALLANLGVLGSQAWIWGLEPVWLAHRYRSALSPVVLERVEREPVQLLGATAGVKVTATLRVKSPIVQDRFGGTVQEFLRSLGLRPEKVPGHHGTVPFAISQPAAQVWRGDTKIEPPSYDARPGGPTPTVLPAGTYRVTRIQWFWGLNGSDASLPPCRDEYALDEASLKALRASASVSVLASLDVHPDFGMRRGRHHQTLKSAPFKVDYAHDRWTQTLESLPVETCKARLEARRIGEERAKAEAIEKKYAGGDRSLSDADNPLRKELCAHDVEAVRRRLAAGPPQYSLAGMIADCKIGPDTPELFAMMMPALYARESDRDAYCHVLDPYLERRDLAGLRKLHAMGLPVACAKARHFNRLLGDVTGMAQLPPREQLEWLRQLHALGAPLCEPSADRNTLLQHAIDTGSEALLSYLLDRGCDPAVLPAFTQHEVAAARLFEHSARMRWMLRVRRMKTGASPITDDLDLQGVERLSKRIGDVSDEEVRRVHPQTGANLLFANLNGQVDSNPAMIAWLVSRGVRLDSANGAGFSWYSDGYLKEFGQRYVPANARVLDTLSVEQLRTMIRPVNLLTGQPGKPLDAVKDMREGGLGDYLCKRGVVAC